MPAFEEEVLTFAMQSILMGAAISLMHATHNPALIIDLVNEGIKTALEKEEENAPTTKDKGGN